MSGRSYTTRLLLGALCLLVTLLSACSKPAPTLPRLTADAPILAFGDSLTYGTGVQAKDSYPAVLERLTGLEVINAGVPGEQSSDGVVRLSPALETDRPQLLILCLGGNDMLRRLPKDETVNNLKTMVAISRQHHVPVLLLGVPRPALFGLESADFYYLVAEQLSVPMEADIIPQVLADRSLHSDLIHPNTTGYRMIAEAIFNKLKESGAL